MKKIYYTWQNIKGQSSEIIRQMWDDRWCPDYIVGITRGGLVPANLISQYLSVPLHTLKVRLRDGTVDDCESNLWMADDAFEGKNILIVDDINDSGNTLNWIKQDWQSSCLPNDARWEHVWGQNVRFATLTNNLASKEDVDYSVWEVNKAEEDCWLVYPWEDFWK
jgi:hypoxanthine phosphoribosyltransferase